MRLFSSFVVVLASAALLTAAPADNRVELPDEMVGVWETVSVVENGIPGNQVYKFDQRKDGTYTLWIDGEFTGRGVSRFHADTVPRTYEYWFTELPVNPDYVGQVHLGIYKVDGDTYTECYALPGEPRPTKFESPALSPHTLSVYKRVRK